MGPNYRATTSRISEAYYAFITNLELPLPDEEDAKEAEKARKTYDDAIQELNRKIELVPEHWMEFNEKQKSLPVHRRLSFDAWYAKFDGQKIASIEQKVQLKGLAFQSWMSKAFKGYAFMADVVNNYNNSAFQQMARSDSDPDDSAMKFYRVYDINPSLDEFIAQAKAGQLNPITFAFDKDSKRSTTEQATWGASASWWGGWFGFGARAGGGRSSVDTSHDHFHMEVTLKAVRPFTITPGGWFSGLAIKAFGHGPWIKGGPVDTGIMKLWGPDGVFSLMPTEVIVAYRPKVVVSVTHDEFHEAKSNFYANGGFSLGPFGFGGSYNRSTSDVRFDETSNTITAEDTSDTPQILAIISSIMPDEA